MTITTAAEAKFYICEKRPHLSREICSRRGTSDAALPRDQIIKLARKAANE